MNSFFISESRLCDNSVAATELSCLCCARDAFSASCHRLCPPLLSGPTYFLGVTGLAGDRLQRVEL